MISLALLASIYSSNCIAFARDGHTVERCDGRLLRLAGIDAPMFADTTECASTDSKNRHWCDQDAAQRATEVLQAFLVSGEPTVWYAGSSDDRGRFLVSISVNGIDAGQYLVSQGLARATPSPQQLQDR